MAPTTSTWLKSLFGKSVFGYNCPDLAANHSAFVTVSFWIQLLTFYDFRSNPNNSISKETLQIDSVWLILKKTKVYFILVLNG